MKNAACHVAIVLHGNSHSYGEAFQGRYQENNQVLYDSYFFLEALDSENPEVVETLFLCKMNSQPNYLISNNYLAVT